jgi:hypothetical protein
MEEILKIKLYDVPTKLVVKLKNPKIRVSKKTGKQTIVTQNTYYLTANVFYAQGHFSTRVKVTDYAKDYLISRLPFIPKLEKCIVKLTYHDPLDNFDLDNKLYFWCKMLLDILKTPSQKQIIRANKYRKPVKTLNVLQEDTVRHVDFIQMQYKTGIKALEIEILGRKKSEQINIF